MNKFQKLIKSIQYIIKQPSLVNLILDQNDVRKLEFQKQYPQLLSLPEVSLDEITNGAILNPMLIYLFFRWLRFLQI
jgi:hypothetical protein